MTKIEGASRISSVLGLNVRPSAAMVLPRTCPLSAIDILRPIPRGLSSLDVTTGYRLEQFCLPFGGAWSLTPVSLPVSNSMVMPVAGVGVS
jgi:hypothetical protein